MGEDAKRGAKYRGIAAELRRFAGKIDYDYRYQAQILALAEGFDRYAARFEQERQENTR